MPSDRYVKLVCLRGELRKTVSRLEREYTSINERLVENIEDDERTRAMDKRRHILRDLGEAEEQLIDVETDIDVYVEMHQ